MNPIASWDFPTSPIYQYPDNQPPYLPAVQVTMDIYPLVPMLAAKIANMAGSLASSSPVRMFCYNTLAANNWTNQAYFDSVKMTADLISIQSGGNVTPALIESIVTGYLTCFSSALAANNTQLYNSLHPSIKAAIGENYATYNDMMTMCSQYNGGSRGHHAARPQMPPQSQALRMNRAPQGNQSSASSIQSNTFNAPPARVFSPTKPATQVKPIVARPVQRAPQPVPSKDQVETDVVQGECEMNRSKHALVYSGVVFPSSVPEHKVTLERLEEAVSAIKDPTVAEIRSLEWGVDYSLDGIIYEAIAEMVKSNDEKCTVTPSLKWLVYPIVSSVEIARVFDKVADQHTLDSMARLLITYVQENAKDDPVLKRAHYAWLAQVDRVMTKVINDWLAGTFYGKTSIDSFLSDAGDLASHISTKYDRAGVAALNRFQSCLFGGDNRMAGKFDLEFITDLGVSDYVTLVVPCAIFTINETAAALNYDIGKKMKKVARDSTGRLYQLLSKLAMISRARHATRSIIVTSDGRRYEFYESGLGNDVFHILEI